MAIDARPAMLPVSPPTTPAAARKAASHQVIDRNRACSHNQRRARPRSAAAARCATASTRRSPLRHWRAGGPPPTRSTPWWRWSTAMSPSPTIWRRIDPATQSSRARKRPGEARREPPYFDPGNNVVAQQLRRRRPQDADRPRIRRNRGANRGLAPQARRRRVGADDLDVRAHPSAAVRRRLRVGGRLSRHRTAARRRRVRPASVGAAERWPASRGPRGRWWPTTPQTTTKRWPTQLARLYADYNYVHPFREGNGRTGTLMLHIVATLRGRTTRPRHDLARRVVRGVTRQHAAAPGRHGRPRAVHPVVRPRARLEGAESPKVFAPAHGQD